MSLMLDEWPADEPPPPPLERRSWPWLAGVVGAVAAWAMVWGVDPLRANYVTAVLAIPIALALLGVALLARTRIPGWALVLAQFVVLPLALLVPLVIAGVVISTDRPELLTPDAGYVYAYMFVIGCIWALTALLICGALTAIRQLVRSVRVRPEPSATRLRLW
ncbi:hypothetical protein [Janibacter sp. GS2]|uniref:hypothetical protein n=1 Tax=Janibacter sp. GS2 TaxID=3442646 RepID=UPI003EC08A0C